ncbi:single-stranded DNA-binding protein [Planomonospora sp. ID67723]|uniref:single-stranded DNA-binding protein n=1 Tax=Planomonospora sp. ID67723 TaxID=2738134 RepID=UPI0018C35409|nr:single-stranded DNA-binding protein [Planomonospora sp. ID67723]MBG0832827.1 single-stranded DNA-binding protein [Planomonospora sp. ID67723]
MDRNEVVLAGRLPEAVRIRTLESGTRLGAWRLIVRRRPRGRGTRVDTISCVSFDPGVVETAAGWLPGDMVEVTGSLRRRWWGKEKSKASGYEVEICSARLVDRVTAVPAGDGEPPADGPHSTPVPPPPRLLRSLVHAGAPLLPERVPAPRPEPNPAPAQTPASLPASGQAPERAPTRGRVPIADDDPVVRRAGSGCPEQALNGAVRA